MYTVKDKIQEWIEPFAFFFMFLVLFIMTAIHYFYEQTLDFIKKQKSSLRKDFI